MIQRIRDLKGQRKIVALTAYDFPMARLLSEQGVDILLVGDSLGMVVLGYTSTHFVTLDDMIRHGQAVVRGNTKSLVVIDMPIGTCDTPKKALKNVLKVCEMTGARAVKIEGNLECVQALSKAGIAVMGHTGLKPQEVQKYRLQGKDAISRQLILDEAKRLEDAGAFSIVLECIPTSLGKEITEMLSIPTIGIGAGPYTDGQILVVSDILGFLLGVRPRFVRKYVDLPSIISDSVRQFREDVVSGNYPSDAESYL